MVWSLAMVFNHLSKVDSGFWWKEICLKCIQMWPFHDSSDTQRHCDDMQHGSSSMPHCTLICVRKVLRSSRWVLTWWQLWFVLWICDCLVRMLLWNLNHDRSAYWILARIKSMLMVDSVASLALHREAMTDGNNLLPSWVCCQISIITNVICCELLSTCFVFLILLISK